jgi:uncharacterized protein (DUF2141 family)
VEGIVSNEGRIMLAVFDNAGDFKNKQNPVLADTVRIKDNSLQLKFKNIPKGTYAIAVFHDENSDGKLNTAKLGIPAEGVGFSGISGKVTRPPKFNDCSFEFKNDTAIVVKMYYRKKE